MTQLPDKLTDEIALEKALRNKAGQPRILRGAGWCLVVGCALSIGAVVMSDSNMTGKISTLTGYMPEAETVETSELTNSPTDTLSVATTDDSPIPENAASGLAAAGRSVSAFGSLSRSVMSVFGADNEGVAASAEFTLSEHETFSEESFFSTSEETARPAVSILPTSRVPVRRAGISGN